MSAAYLVRSWNEDGHIKTITIGPFADEAHALEFLTYLPPEQKVSVTYRSVGCRSLDYSPGEFIAHSWETR